MNDDEEQDSWEINPVFMGECTCEHEREDHSWGTCDMAVGPNTVCPCKAGWEE